MALLRLWIPLLGAILLTGQAWTQNVQETQPAVPTPKPQTPPPPLLPLTPLTPTPPSASPTPAASDPEKPEIPIGLTEDQQQQKLLKQQEDFIKQQADALAKQRELINKAERDGIEVRIKDIARFRGVRMNQLQGYGLVTGLEGTGDSSSTPQTSQMLTNLMTEFGVGFGPGAAQIKTANVALVSVTAELSTSTSPGNTIDVTVQSIGDAKSLQGGYLLQTRLYGSRDRKNAMAVAQGSLSIGGFNVSSGGSSTQKNHVNVARIPGGAIVEKGVSTQMLFEGGKLFLELVDSDLTTSQRVSEKINQDLPGYKATPIDGGTVEVVIPISVSAMEAMSRIEPIKVFADIMALIVVNERTGTIVMGGNVRLGPAVIAHGSLQVSVQQDLVVSQPEPFSKGKTVTGTTTSTTAEEEKAQIGVVTPTASVNDLAKILQMLRLTPRDIIAILQALREQGALKARIKVQ